MKREDPLQALWRRNWLFFWGTCLAVSATLMFVLIGLGGAHPLIAPGVGVGLVVTARLAKSNGFTIAQSEALMGKS